MARTRIKGFHFETNKTSLYHLHSTKEITSDEHKTLTKISTHNLSQQFPQTSAHIGHDKIRNKKTGEKQSCNVMNETEQRYHSNKQEFLALKWAVTEQFHEYLSLYRKNRNEFVVRTDNNPLTYIFSSANLDAAGQ